MGPKDAPDTPFTVGELEARGLGRPDLHWLLAERRVRRAAHGVYVPGHLPDSLEVRARALSLVVAEHHVVVDRSAAWLHGVDCFSLAEQEAGPPLEICALRGTRAARRRDVDGRTRDLGTADVMEVGGIRVTTPLRTALDLGCHLRRREAYAAMNELARRNGLTAQALIRQLHRYRRRRGVVQLRELAPLVDLRIESQRECWSLLAINDAGLPLPEPQVWVEVDGVPTFRLDFAYRLAKVCVEYDGIDAHLRTPAQREHDARRRAWLREHGWTVIVVRRGDFTGPALDRWLGELRAALEPTYSTRRW